MSSGVFLVDAPPMIRTLAMQAGAWIAGGTIVAVLLVALGLRLPVARRLAAVRPALASLLRRPGVLVLVVLISLAVQPGFVVASILLGREVGVDAPVGAWFIAWPVSKLVAALPISLGGIGVREGVLVALMAPFGAPGDAVLATGLLWQGAVIVGGVGGLVVTQWVHGADRPGQANADNEAGASTNASARPAADR
jgi:uncharacterized membrane protein YbhN (UPF0104 family)